MWSRREDIGYELLGHIGVLHILDTHREVQGTIGVHVLQNSYLDHACLIVASIIQKVARHDRASRQPRVLSAFSF